MMVNDRASQHFGRQRDFSRPNLPPFNTSLASIHFSTMVKISVSPLDKFGLVPFSFLACDIVGTFLSGQKDRGLRTGSHSLIHFLHSSLPYLSFLR